MKHRAIETRYRGRKFRSRLEARYAVLFDSLGIKWDYEPEGFELGEGLRYLPDFFFRFPHDVERGYWVEIKPTTPEPEELRKLALLAQQTGHHAYLFAGSPDAATVWVASLHGGPARQVARCLGWSDAPLALCSPLLAPSTPATFARAVNHALSARFEFGESGAC